MKLLVDSREQNALCFSSVEGVTVEVVALSTGDYTAEYQGGERDSTIIERKNISDLFHSFTHEYENEKAKIKRAKEAGLRYILAVEATAMDVRRGHSYWKGGEEHRVRKPGISQVRQIMTLHKRGDIDEVWWCAGRLEMAFRIQEYFLAEERIRAQLAKSARLKTNKPHNKAGE